MNNPNWLPLISFVSTVIILLASFMGGYAVLRKRVKDLENDNKNKLDGNKHADLCKIATLEMKEHVSDTMKNTLDEFEEKVFQPAMAQILSAINGDI